jgi:hypothetical protein
MLSFGAMNATAQYDCHHRWSNICDRRLVRRDYAFSVMASTVPPGWLAIMLITGFGADGIQFSATPEIPDR